FLIKRAAGIALIAAAAGAAAFGAADIQQPDSDEFRQLIKQSDKLVKKGNLPEAERLLLRALDLNKDDADTRLRLAFVYLKERRLRSAYETSFGVAKADPKNSHAYAILGATLLGSGKFPEARSVFYTAIQMNRREALACAGSWMLHFYENRIPQILQNLSQAVFHDPSEPDYLF